MNLRFIETFLWAARLGSFRAAAERLNITQASVSNRVAALESEIGHQLFERLPGGVRLSSVGQRAIEPAEELLRVAINFRDAVAHPSLMRGTVSIGTIDSIVHAWLPRFIEQVKLRYPALSLDLNVDTSFAVARDVADRKIDLALAMGPVHAPGLKNVDLGRMECVWVAAPAFGLKGLSLTLRDLASYPILAFSRNSVPHQWLQRQFDDLGLAPVISNSNSLATIIRLARDGIGIAPLPRAILADALQEGALEVLDVAPSFPALMLHAAYADDPDNTVPSILAQIARDSALDSQIRSG
ncbi:LysR family transcriptional regulator [Plastorhodobacter daqingensis]|uniref:LysR family transcriptional regulator n=1 Tax=Plastorhodobacter daqingensis TaxID=1387281 RepID=A0ABW2UIG3_9RHOB